MKPIVAIMSKHRLDAFSDGVFAIATTLLVLNLHIPDLVSKASAGDLWNALVTQWPRFVGFVVSFAVIAIFWIGHHVVMHYVRHVDRMFLNINSLYLLVVAFMPFAAGLIGQYGDNRTAELIYGSTLIAAGLVLRLLWGYASGNHRLVDKDLSEKLIHLANKLILAAPAVYIIALALAFIRPRFALFIYLVVPLFYIIGGPIDRVMALDVRDPHTPQTKLNA